MVVASRVQTPVLIVGGGPVGLTAAILLARNNIKSIVVERHYNQLDQPKAHAINPRSLEIFRQAGLDIMSLRKAGLPPEEGNVVRFVASMTGVEFGHLAYERQTDETRAITPEPLFNIAQPLLVDFLYAAASSSASITIWRGVQYEEFIQSTEEGRQVSLLLERANNRTFEIESEYIFACDGSKSRLRGKFDIPFSTLPGHPDRLLHHVSIHIKADLRRFGSGTLWFFIGPTQQGTFICYDPAKSWVYVTNIEPEITPVSTFTETYCREIIDEVSVKTEWFKIGRKLTYLERLWERNVRTIFCP